MKPLRVKPAISVVALAIGLVHVAATLRAQEPQRGIRVEAATDSEVLEALKLVMRREGIIPALESAHAFVTALHEAPHLSADAAILINQSGRGDKDIFTIADALGDARWRAFLRDKVAAWEHGG